MKFKLLFIFLIATFNFYCATLKQTINPLENPLLSWIFDKSCISVDIPPITLTTEKTVLEKQILGEKTELMPDGWIILMPNYVHPYSFETINQDKSIKTEIDTILLYKTTMDFLMFKNYVGINQNGDFLILPERFRNVTDKKYLEIAYQLTKIMNSSKNKVYEYLKTKEVALAQQFLEDYNNTFQFNGWRYDEKKGWYK